MPYGNGANLWFGTIDYADWHPTPLRGAEMSPSGWELGGALLNGGGYQRNSFGSHKVYTFEWPESSSVEVASLMKSYADGTYGRGLLYFLDPLIYDQNILPAQWADPSMSLDPEAPSLVYGVTPTPISDTLGRSRGLPVNGATYDLTGVPAGFRGAEDAVFLPIPTGYTLFIGARYSSTGTGGVFVAPRSSAGVDGTPVKLTELAPGSPTSLQEAFTGGMGVWLYVGRSTTAASTVSMRGLIAKLVKSDTLPGGGLPVTNLATNPSAETASGTVEVKRNLMPNPRAGVAGTASYSPVGVTLARSTTETHDGNASIAVTLNGAASNEGVVALLTASPGGLPGRSFAGGAWVKAPAGVAYYVRTRTSGAVAQDSPGGNYVGTGAWQWAPSGVVVGQADAAQIQMHVRTNAIASGVIYVTQVIVEERVTSPTAAEYFDGATAAPFDTDFTPAWLGTAHASASVLRAPGVAPIAPGAGVGNAFAYQSKKWAKSGLASIAAQNNGVSPNASIFPAATAAFTPGKTYTLLATARLDAPLTPNVGSVYFNRATLVQTGFPNQQSAPFPNVAGEHAIRFVFTVDPAATTLTLRLGAPTVIGEVIRYDNFAIVEGDYSGPFFDGNTPGFSWTGTPNASTSTGIPIPATFLQDPNWIPGMGHSGCRFAGKPTYISNTATAGGQVSYAATFREVGTWTY